MPMSSHLTLSDRDPTTCDLDRISCPSFAGNSIAAPAPQFADSLGTDPSVKIDTNLPFMDFWNWENVALAILCCSAVLCCEFPILSLKRLMVAIDLRQSMSFGIGM